MKSLLQHVKAITTAIATEVRDDKLWYKCFFQEPQPGGDSWQLDVGIPLEDLKGAVFTASMYVDDEETMSPKLLQRWIRKTLEEQKEQEEMIAKAREEWNNGQ